MKIIFMGTPDFALSALKKINEGHEITAVVTQPDRPKGRGKGVAFSPVKDCALALGLPVLQPEKIRDAAFISLLKTYEADAYVVVAYGQMLPQAVLDIPPKGCINIHASLLPKYRGAAPMQRAILNGDEETGISIMYMDKGMDTGDVILSKSLAIGQSDRFTDLHEKMTLLSADCIAEALDLIAAGRAERSPQDNNLASYAPMLRKEDGRINWENSSKTIYNQVRALDPWPGTYSSYKGKVLKIWDCDVSGQHTAALPGEILAADDKLLVKTGDGALSVTVVQGEGGKRMAVSDYLRGRKMEAGDFLN